VPENLDDVLPALLSVRPLGSGSREAHDLRRRAARGELVRVGPGTFVTAEEWQVLDPRQRHVLRTAARVPRLDARVAASHWSALALHQLPRISAWPPAAEVVDPGRARTQVSTNVVRHAASLPDEEVTRVHGVRTTTPHRSALDAVLGASFLDGVAVLDAALHRGIVDREVLADEVDRRAARGARGASGARRALTFARSECESPGETLTRVQLHLLGAPEPVLQQAFPLGASMARVDFWFPEHGVVLEFDGAVKYADPRILRGRAVAEVVADEKRRENALRRAHPRVRAVVRVTWAEVADLRRFRALLQEVGVPCTR